MITDYLSLFHQIITSIPNAQEGKMFGAPCIKADNGKVAAIFWQNTLLCKLSEEDLDSALNLKGANRGHHLYDPFKSMKGWVELPATQSARWLEFATLAINHVA